MTQVSNNDRISVVKRKVTKMKGALVAIHKEDNAPGIIFGSHDSKISGNMFIVIRVSSGKPTRLLRSEFTLKKSSTPEEILTVLEVNRELDDVLRDRMSKAVIKRIEYLNKRRNRK